MLNIKQYVRPQSLQEAYELCQDRRNIIIGGMLWLKMQNRSVDVAIDLCDLGLDHIEENDEEFSIGAMVTLRQLELHHALNNYTQGAIRESVRHIVGVQFRNLATIGGSIFGKYGFSDVLTMFMALDTYVELYHGGIIPLHEFVDMRPSLDILVRIIVKKTPMKVVYLSQRNTKTDFPVLTCAMNIQNGVYTCVVGARPLKAKAIVVNSVDECQDLIDIVMKDLNFGSNLRASAKYRERIAKVLIKRAYMALQGGQEHEN